MKAPKVDLSFKAVDEGEMSDLSPSEGRYEAIDDDIPDSVSEQLYEEHRSRKCFGLNRNYLFLR